MAAAVESIEIARPPEEVFACATDFARFPEWQGGVVSARREDEGPLAVGARATVTRQIGPRGRKLARREEITELDPARSWTVRGIGGAVVAIAKGAIEPLARDGGSRVTISLDFEGQGIGKLLVPLVIRRQAREQLPENMKRLRELLEQRA